MSKPEEYERRLNFFHSVVLTCVDDECLIWPFDRNSKGYGRITIDGKRVLVSREVCRRVSGNPVSESMHAAHSCGNGSGGCVNPKHLSWKTRSQNEADKIIHGTSNRGERCGRSVLTEDDVKKIFSLKGRVSSQFGVHQATISKIWKKQRWGWMHELNTDCR